MQRVVWVLVLVLALAGGAFWLTTRSERTRGPRSAPASVEHAQPTGASPVLAPATSVVAEGVEAEPAAQAPSSGSREAAPTSAETELAGAQWVTGRVVLPPDTPLDEEAFVIAESTGLHRSERRSRVEPDGRFRVPFAEKARTGRLRLAARYLRLGESVRWKTKEDDLVLTPVLGARIAGHVRPPARTDPKTLGGKVEIQRTHRGDAVFEMGGPDERPLGAALDFAFDALQVEEGTSFAVLYDGPSWVGKCDTLELEPGKTTEVELELRPGITLEGVVRDEHGAPLAEVNVNAYVESPGQWSNSEHREVKTGADGAFRLGAFRAGKLHLRAQLTGFAPLERELGRLDEGARPPALELVLQRGTTIAGTVAWPDGSPAEAFLELVPERGDDRGQEQNAKGKTDTTGHFAISGLTGASYRVIARATKTEEITVTSDSGRERKKKQRSSWIAHADEVRAGTSNLALTLTSGLELTGRVVDDVGAPVASFSVMATSADSGSDFGPDASKHFRDAGGAFVLTGLAPGTWTLRASTTGRYVGEGVRVELPVAAPVTLVLPREATVRGVVLDPGGTPVPHARVRVMKTRGDKVFGHFEDEHEADAHGAFEIASAPLTGSLRASGADHAPSESLPIELAPGDSVDGLVLRLRSGGTILGEVIGLDGRPAEVETLSFNGEGFNSQAEVDADGRFRCTGVPPGEIRLYCQLEQGLHLQQRVTVAEGETVRVRLAPATTGAPVRVHGTVRAAGEAVAEANVFVRADGARLDAGSSSSASTGTDADGAYELTLPGPGRYRMDVGKRGLSWIASLDVPATSDFAFDVAITVGTISGRVTDASGAPLAGIRVQSVPERHEGGSHGSARVLTEDDGRYELRVPAGRHAVKAGGSNDRAPGSPPYTEARVGDLVVTENGHVRGIDLRLSTGGILEGRVRRSDGSPVAFAWVRSEEAGVARPLGFSDENGNFRLEGISLGTLDVVASQQSAACAPVRVEITAGETARVELELVPATRVHLVVRQGGTPVGCELVLVDERGASHSTRSGVTNGEFTLGPLFPGRYTVRGTRDVKHAERSFEVVEGQAELELELVFE